MLDTLLDIGKTLRGVDGIKHYRYIKTAPISSPKMPVKYLSLPIRLENDNFVFGFDQINEIKDEVLKRYKLYYLAYKTSEADSDNKYLWGDIYYGVNDKQKDIGYYRMGKGKRPSSFRRLKEKDLEVYKGTNIEGFRAAYDSNIEKIESMLKREGNGQAVFLHFVFPGERAWYEFKEELEKTKQKLLYTFFKEVDGQFIVQKSLYKTLSSDEKDKQFPTFSSSYQNRTKAFKDRDEALNLFYAINYSKSPIIRVRDMKIIVLPKAESGETLSANHLEDFFAGRTLDEEESVEETLNSVGAETETEDDTDEFYKPVVEGVAEKITQYDFIFSKAGSGATTPDIDVVELSGIQKSFLADLSKRVRGIRNPLLKERDEYYPKPPTQFQQFDIKNAFLRVLGDVTKGKNDRKFQSHLFKVLPQIYTGTYYRDAILLSAFIEKVEFDIRDAKPTTKPPSLYFNLLKYDFYFLNKLQIFGEEFMNKNSDSYQAGLLLGRMAQPLERKKKIAAFEKRYVGLLSRHIADLRGVMKLANFINEKLLLHDVAYWNLQQAAVNLSVIVKRLTEKNYRKYECAFGFFESYFGKFEEPKDDAQDSSSSTESDPAN